MLEIILSVVLYLAGAVVERETDGGITATLYQDENGTHAECVKIKK